MLQVTRGYQSLGSFRCGALIRLVCPSLFDVPCLSRTKLSERSPPTKQPSVRSCNVRPAYSDSGNLPEDSRRQGQLVASLCLGEALFCFALPRWVANFGGPWPRRLLRLRGKQSHLTIGTRRIDRGSSEFSIPPSPALFSPTFCISSNGGNLERLFAA